jgi:hypothetical protein
MDPATFRPQIHHAPGLYRGTEIKDKWAFRMTACYEMYADLLKRILDQKD